MVKEIHLRSIGRAFEPLAAESTANYLEGLAPSNIKILYTESSRKLSLKIR